MAIRYDDKFVKEPNLEQEYTKEQIEDLVKCSQDITYFLNFVTIVTLDGGRKKLGNLLYDYQYKIIDVCNKNRFSIFLCSRQSGKTTTLGAYALWYALFNKDKFIGIASNKASGAKDVLRRIKLMYEELPFWLKPGVVEYNKGCLEFENGSRIETSATTEDTFRGRSISLLLLDEYSFIQNNIAKEFYTSAYPAIAASKTSKIIIISTPNGLFNHFHELYTNAEKNLNEYKHLKVTWDQVPGRDEEWKKQQLRNMSQQQFDQEFNVSFGNSANTLLSKEAISYMESTVTDPIHYDLENKLRIYEYPQEKNNYIMGIDPSKGSGAHDATIQIYKIESLNPIKTINVATFQSNTTNTYKFSEIINKLSIYYNNAKIFIENNGEGATVSQNLWWVFENPNLYNHGNKIEEIGIRATKSTKSIAITTMKKLIDDGQLIIKDKETARQLSTYTEKKNSLTTVDGKDDLISGLYWMAFAFTTNEFEDSDFFDINKSEEDKEIWGILSDIENDYYLDQDFDF